MPFLPPSPPFASYTVIVMFRLVNDGCFRIAEGGLIFRLPDPHDDEAVISCIIDISELVTMWRRRTTVTAISGTRLPVERL